MNATINHHVNDLRLKLLDSLVKVFVDEEPMPSMEEIDFSVLRNDRLSFQLAYTGAGAGTERHQCTRFAKLSVDSPVAEYVTLRTVESVPCLYTTHPGADDNYLRKAPGLFPDLLKPAEFIAATVGLWKSLWIDVEVPADCEPGDYPVVLRLDDPQTEEALAEVSLAVTVLPFVRPEQVFPRTEWFHADCLADHYGVPVFSEEHWALLDRFITAAVKRGINMILTPQFTPPLDTGVGYERTTVQLVEVFKEADGWRFDFKNLRRWIELCLARGVKYFEMSHLFSQWGAVAAPKVMGWENGEWKRLFGWDPPAVGAYTDFLNAYLPRLRAVLRDYGVEDRTYFHISDEPSQQQFESYRAARESVREALDGCKFLEAISDYDFYAHGLIDHPVCATSRIDAFLEHGTPGLWSYYCTAQYQHLSNCFIAQPSGCTRLYGAQLFKFDIAGSLRWGYNFYNSEASYYHIEPELSNDMGCVVPAGDPFIVYPGPGGEPLESLRMLLLDDAMRDLRALTALSERIGRDKTVELMEQGLNQPLTFSVYPDHPLDARWLLGMRKRVNQALCEHNA